jgi:hypothetical protein
VRRTITDTKASSNSNSAVAPVALADEAVAAVLDNHQSDPIGLSSVDRDFCRAMIAIAAYYVSEQRRFELGHEVDDWTAAEAAVDSTLGGMPRRVTAVELESV